ncbi:hypothetical protein GCM10010276_64420 [Streptomyces longisporus]|uniref:Secreted protein n=1 Tax=Streptomyces longisporus TaxID=1948 RepID=A0ABP6A9B2_STRLO
MLHGDLGDLVELLLHLLLVLLLLLLTVALVLAELLQQLLEGLLLAELLELLQRTHAHAHTHGLLLLPERLLLVLLVGRRARELLALLLSQLAHLRGGAHTGVTFP